jgi:hypothetical protein
MHPINTISFHCELEKVKFPKLFGASNNASVEAWLENMSRCLHFASIPPT